MRLTLFVKFNIKGKNKKYRFTLFHKTSFQKNPETLNQYNKCTVDEFELKSDYIR